MSVNMLDILTKCSERCNMEYMYISLMRIIFMYNKLLFVRVADFMPNISIGQCVKA